MNVQTLQFETIHPKNVDHALAAFTVAAWSYAAPTMKTMDHKAVLAEPYGILAFDAMSGQVVAHVAITQLQAGHAHLGGLVVDPMRAGESIATHTTAHLLKTAAAALSGIETCQAYANDRGVGFFESLGGVLLGSRGEDPYKTGCTNVIDLTAAIGGSS